MIQTFTYTLSPKTYFKILVENRLRRFWWLYLLMIVFSLSALDMFGEDHFLTAYIIVTVLYIPGVIIYLYYWASSAKNRNLYIPHRLTIDENKITSTSEGNVYNELPLNFILNVVERKTYWLLYIAKSQFLYLPKAALPTTEDQAEFRRLIMSTKNKR